MNGQSWTGVDYWRASYNIVEWIWIHKRLLALISGNDNADRNETWAVRTAGVTWVTTTTTTNSTIFSLSCDDCSVLAAFCACKQKDVKIQKIDLLYICWSNSNQKCFSQKKVQQKGCFCENLEHSKDFLHCQNGRDSCCRVIYQPCYLWDKMCNCSRGSPWQQERVSLYCHADFPTRDLALHLWHSLYRILLSDAFVWIQESDIDFLKRDPAHHLWHSALQTGSSHLSDSDSDKSQDCMFVAPALLYTISDKNFVRTLLFGPKLKFGESWGIRCRCRMHPSPPLGGGRPLPKPCLPWELGRGATRSTVHRHCPWMKASVSDVTRRSLWT